MRKIWDIPGGVHPAENKAQSLGSPIGSLPLPDHLVLPLNQHAGAPAISIVSTGDQVLKGQMIAEPQGLISAAVHAPTSGTIIAIEDRVVPHPSGMTARCIVLSPDGQETWIERKPVPDYKKVAGADLVQLIQQAGICGLGGAGFPASVKLSPRQPIHTLIINGTECEPYITADDSLMQERATDIIAGVEILAHILGNPETILIGVEDNKPEAFERLSEAAADTAIEVVEFPTKYPSGGEKQLIQILTGQEVPSGKLPADLGIVCQNVGTTYAIYRAVCHGEPLISRITTVTGKGCDSNRNYEVLIGTPVEHLLAANGFHAEKCPRLIMGGPMMGFALPDPAVPVVKTTNCIIAPDAAEIPPPQPAQPCIRCGLCAEACPASLLPQQLFWYSQSQNFDRLEAHNLFDCIECGACAYVCPSNIPLVQYYRAAKGEIRTLAIEKKKSDHARERFEFHKARIEKAEAEKAAKREARRLAAEAAKQKTAQEKSTDTTPGPADDLIQAALARAAARKASPEQQQAKLERGVETAKNRLSVAEDKFQEAQQENVGQEMLDKLQAKMDEARLKLTEAQRKLSEFTPEQPAATDSTATKIADKMQASPRQQLTQKINVLKDKIRLTEEKLASSDDEKQRVALQNGLDKQRQKLAEAEQELDHSSDADITPATDKPATDAASAAIAKAQARAQAQASLSPLEKTNEALASLEKRITKARGKLAAAETEGSEHIDTLRAALSKLEDKYQATLKERDQLQTSEENT